jgi:hypothetical protein
MCDNRLTEREHKILDKAWKARQKAIGCFDRKQAPARNKIERQIRRLEDKLWALDGKRDAFIEKLDR